MSEYKDTDTIDERGGNILEYQLEKSLFNVKNLGGKTPDIDGLIRLRDGRGNYLERYLFYQLKSKGEVKNNKYHCRRKVIDHLLNTNIPTILFVVDVTRERVFWYHLDLEKIKRLGLKCDNKGRTFDLPNYEITEDNQKEVHERLVAIAGGHNYDEAKGLLKEISTEFDIEVSNFIGLLFLLQKIDKTKVGEVFQEILGLSSDEIVVIINKLAEKKLILETKNCYLLENEQVGREAAKTFLDEIMIDKIFDVVKMKEERSLILQQISNEKHQEISRFLNFLAKETLNSFKTKVRNEIISINLELLKNYAFRVPDLSLKIIRHLVREKIVKQCKIYNRASVEYDLYTPTSNVGVIFRCIKVLKGLRYFRTRAVFKILVSLCESANINIKEASANAINDTVSYNPSALQAIKYRCQTEVLDEIEKLGVNRRKRLLELLCNICDKLLEPSFRGSSMTDYRTAVISFGALSPLPELENIRARSIALLKDLYNSAGNVGEKKLILSTLSKATNTPHRGEVKEELDKIIESNCETVIIFYTEILPNADNEIIREIEKQTDWFSRRFENARGLQKLKSIIENMQGYELYKTFVGYDTDRNFGEDWQAAKDKRESKLQEIIDDMGPDNFEDWTSKLLEVAESYPNVSPGEFGYFRLFLRKLGTRKPCLALKMMDKNLGRLRPFLADILLGVLDSAIRDRAKEILKKWSSYKNRLSVCVEVFAFNDTYDFLLIRRLLYRALEDRNAQAIKGCVYVLIREFRGSSKERTLIMQGINELTVLGDAGWAENVWFRDKQKDFILSLKHRQVLQILNNLLLADKINYHLEAILKDMAIKEPKEIMKFLGDRIVKESKRTIKSSKYESMPYEFHELGITLNEHVAVVIDTALKWGRKRDWKFIVESGHFVKKIFRQYTSGIESVLITHIHENKKRTPETVCKILESYEGNVCVHNICKELIKTCGDKKGLKARIFRALSITGIVCGERGFVDAYKKKREEIKAWESDENIQVQKFAKEYGRHLDSQIHWEDERANENIALYKRGLR